jgi:hypothetical protein
MRLHYITPLLAAGAAAVVIAAAPTALATDQQSCNGSGSGTVCQSRGNVTDYRRLRRVAYGDALLRDLAVTAAAPQHDSRRNR